MPATPSSPSDYDSGLERLISQLTDVGVAVWDDALPPELAMTIRADVVSLRSAGRFLPACVGRGPRRQRLPSVRGDFVAWLQTSDGPPDEAISRSSGLRAVVGLLDILRRRLAQRCFVPLSTLEMHASHYPPGAFYRAHLDRFVGSSERHFTFVYFLNPQWQPGDGGHLRVLRPIRKRYIPRMGRLVLFHTPEVLHEVTETRRDRFALTGWLGTAHRP